MPSMMKAAIFVEPNRIVLDDIEEAYDLLANQRDGARKIGIVT